MEERDVNQITNQEISETVSDAVPKKNRKPLIIGIILGFILIASIIGVASFKYIKDMQDIKVVKRKFYTKLEQGLSGRWGYELSEKNVWECDSEEVIEMIDEELKALRNYKNVKVLSEIEYEELKYEKEKASKKVSDMLTLAESASKLIEKKEKDKEISDKDDKSAADILWKHAEDGFFSHAKILGYSKNDIGSIYKVETLLKDAKKEVLNYESRIEIQEFNKNIVLYIEALELSKKAIKMRDEEDAKDAWDEAYMQRYEALTYFVDNGFEMDKMKEKEILETGVEDLYNLRTGAYLSKYTEKIGKHADKLVMFNELIAETRKLETIIDSPYSTNSEVNAANRRLQEIAEIIEEYNSEPEIEDEEDIDISDTGI